MKEIVGTQNPEFWPECKCPFFTLPTGSLSCYGDEMVTTLQCLASNDKIVDLKALTSAIVKKFGDPSSPYQEALSKRAAKVYPVPGPWIQGSLIKALANIDAGLEPPGSADAEDNDGFTTSLAAFLTESGQGADVARLVTTNPMVLDHLRLQYAIVSNYLAVLDQPIRSAAESLAAELPELAAEVREVLAAAEDDSQSIADLVSTLGKACPLPGSFKSSLVVLARCGSDYVGAVRQNILAGGDCNARANFIGACLGASLGIEAIPLEWIEKVIGIEEILEAAIQVFLRQ